MDNNAVYAAQQAQLGKIYGGLDPTCRRPEDLGGQTTINSRFELNYFLGGLISFPYSFSF